MRILVVFHSLRDVPLFDDCRRNASVVGVVNSAVVKQCDFGGDLRRIALLEKRRDTCGDCEPNAAFFKQWYDNGVTIRFHQASVGPARGCRVVGR